MNDTVRAIAWRTIDNAGPAGSISSNAVDMAQWVRLQLGEGRDGGRQLISEWMPAEMHAPQTIIRLDPAARARRTSGRASSAAASDVRTNLASFRRDPRPPQPRAVDPPSAEPSSRPPVPPSRANPNKPRATATATAAATAARTRRAGQASAAVASDDGAPAGDGAAGRGESVARAYDQLRDLIVWGRLAPGSRIVESEVADRLGVSRTPTRSALHRLQQEGYVTAPDRAKERRLVVAPLTQDDARELFHIVGQLEALAARTAAELPQARRAALVKQLRQLNRELAGAARGARPDPLRIFDLDTAFHRTYVEGAAGPRLRALHDAIKPQAERYIRLYISSLVDEIATSVEEHDVIIRHVDAGDQAAAQEAVDTNWRNAALRLSRVIDTLGERGSW